MMFLTTGLSSVPALAATVGGMLAYVDPGTTSSLFALLAPLLALFGVFLGFLLWPFRKALGALFGRKKAGEPEAEGQSPEAGEEGGEEEA